MNSIRLRKPKPLVDLVNTASPFAEQRVDDPTAADMWSRTPAMTQHIGIRAAGVDEGILKHRQPLERFFRVYGLGLTQHLGRPPCRQNAHGPEWVAENITQELCMESEFLVVRPRTGRLLVHEHPLVDGIHHVP